MSQNQTDRASEQTTETAVLTSIVDQATQEKEAIQAMAAQISTWFVRKDGKFFEIDNLGVRLSKDDVERACINRIVAETDGNVNEAALAGALKLAIRDKIGNPRYSIPVWNGLRA